MSDRFQRWFDLQERSPLPGQGRPPTRVEGNGARFGSPGEVRLQYSFSSGELRCVSSHQAPLDQFNEEQIASCHRSQEKEVERRQGFEAERPR